MAKRERYEPGTFCWVDLMTTDTAGARSFYGELFGWEFEDTEMPFGPPYTTLRLNGDAIGGLYEQPAEPREQGMPPSWFNHVSVEDADATASMAKELGGQVLMGPMDVMENGRTLMIQDPTGAMLGCWQPKEQIGATRVNGPGCLTWNELATKDVEKASEFYSGLFGWEADEIDTGDSDMRYWTIRHDGGAAGRNGGMRQQGPAEEGVPPNWTPYFGTNSVEDTVAKANELGGKTVFEPMEVPAGKFAGLGDPQGAVFALFEGEFDD